MHRSVRAPVLSATRRRDSCWIIGYLATSTTSARLPRRLALVANGQDARDLALRQLQASGVLERAGGRLEAKVEQLLPRLDEPVLQLVVGHVSVLVGLHSNSSASRLMIFVLMGSF